MAQRGPYAPRRSKRSVEAGGARDAIIAGRRYGVKTQTSVLADSAWFYPAMVLLGTVVVYPMIRTLALSLVHESLATGFHAQFSGLAHFERLFGDSRFHSTLWTTGLFTAGKLRVKFLIGLLL